MPSRRRNRRHRKRARSNVNTVALTETDDALLDEDGEECQRLDGILMVYKKPTSMILNVYLTFLEACPDGEGKELACRMISTQEMNPFLDGMDLLIRLCDKRKVAGPLRYLKWYKNNPRHVIRANPTGWLSQ